MARLGSTRMTCIRALGCRAADRLLDQNNLDAV
jgi:hypothetical protein